MSEERVELYRYRPPEGQRVPLLVRPGEVEEGVPDEPDIAEAVRGLLGGRARVPSGMIAEDMKGWQQ